MLNLYALYNSMFNACTWFLSLVWSEKMFSERFKTQSTLTNKHFQRCQLRHHKPLWTERDRVSPSMHWDDVLSLRACFGKVNLSLWFPYKHVTLLHLCLRRNRHPLAKNLEGARACQVINSRPVPSLLPAYHMFHKRADWHFMRKIWLLVSSMWIIFNVTNH